MDRKDMHNWNQRSNSEQLQINAKLFNVIHKRNISVQEKVQKIQKLLGQNPQLDINAQDGNDNWNTALHLAINKNEFEVVNFLLTQGANTTIENGDGKTPLDLAEEGKHVEIIDSLKSHISQAEWLCHDFALGEALEGADCFFDALAQGMSVLCVPGRLFNVQSLRQSCCDYARDNQDGIYDSQTGTTWLQVIADNACTGGYATGSGRLADFESYLAKLKEGTIIWGRPQIEGRMLCKMYGIKLHLLEKQTFDGQDLISPHLADSSGSRAVTMDESTNLYKEPDVIHLLNEGQAYFVPILPKSLVQKELTEQRAHRPHSETDSNSHAAATGKQAATTVLPPFSGEITVDTELELSHIDFKHHIENFYENTQLSAINQLKATPAFPTLHVLAHFASMAYTDYQHKVPKPPDGWMLLTTASHFMILNGYFGTAYWHPVNQQVVIAHQGIDDVSAFVTDIEGVYFNNYIRLMSSASTFANKVVAVLQEIEEDNRVSFELFFTGHSLGGWLAQITTFTTKYLEEKDGTFLKRLKREEYKSPASSTVQDSHDVPHSYHPHTVVFDSPGCKDMLSQMADKLGVHLNGRYIDLQHLDITSYLSAPNLINTCNSHLGTVYRIFIDLSDKGCFSENTSVYNLAVRQIDKIVEAFDPKTGQVSKDGKGKLKIREVVDWPVSASLKGGAEWKYFFKWVKRLNNYHPEVMDTVLSNVPKGYHQLRYQTKAYDECANSISIFTQDEREFLERYRWLCHVPEFFKPEDLFSVMNNTEAQKEAEQKLRNFELGNGNVRCPVADTLEALIPYVKRLVRLFPQVIENIKAKLSSAQIRSWVYQYETQCYIEMIHQSALDFNPGSLGLREFLERDQQIWQLQMIDGDAWTGLTKVYRLFQHTSCTASCFSAGDCTILKLKRLVTVNRMINLSTLLASMETPHLLMIACETNQPDNDELSDMLKELFNTLKHKKTMKIILTMPSEDSTTAFVQETARAILGEGLKTTDEKITWSDLTRSSQRKILEKAVILQGRKVALNQLTSAESVTNSFLLADLFQETEIRIGEELVPSACRGYNEEYYIDRTLNHNIIIRQDISSDKREGKFADLLASDEQEFKQLCQQNPKSNVHWLDKDKAGELIWQQSQGNLKTLREYIDDQKSHSYGPKDLDKLLDQAGHQRFMLIADKAGMGKSTVLTHLSEQIKQKFPAHWVVRIDLNYYTELLEVHKGKKMDKERVLEFVSEEVLKLDSRLGMELFKKNFEGNVTNKVVIMLDGFDEISPSYKETVIDVLQVLKQTSLEQLWVTTRPHLREELEDKLQQLAYTLQPFSEVEQVEFLNKFWLQYLNLETTNQHRLEIYATALIRKLAQSISYKDKEFAGIPLQTRMLAEAFKEEFISFYLSEKSEPELPHKLDLLGLYRRFIDTKYNIYYKEKSKTPTGTCYLLPCAAKEQRERDLKGTQLQHHLLALEALFTEDQVTRLQINHESTSSDEELARIGIVQRNHDGKPQFIHHTFAEYFVADFLMNQLTKTTKQHIQVQEFLLSKVLLRTDCHVIRAFVDRLLEKSKPSKEAMKEYGKILEQWSEGEVLSRLIGLHQRALRQAATEDNTHITEFLLNSLKSGEHSNVLRNMLLATDADGRTAWHMAANNGKLDALEKIWECVDEVTPTVTCSLPLLMDTSDETALHLATKRGHINLLEKPWNLGKEAQIYAGELKKQMLLAQDSDGKTAWHVAIDERNDKVLEKIGRCAKEVLVNPSELENTLLLIQDRDGNTALHRALKKGSVKVLNKLLAFAKETQLTPHEFKNKLLLAENKHGNTAWHAAAQRYMALETLWSWAKEVKLKPEELSTLLLAKDRYGNTVWHIAYRKGDVFMFDAIWDWTKEAQLKPNEIGELILAKNKCGETMWHERGMTDKLGMLETLLSFIMEAEVKPNEISELLLAQDKYIRNVWHETVERGNLEMLEALLTWVKKTQLKANVLTELLLVKNGYGKTVWHAAVTRGYSVILEALLRWAKEAQLKPNELSELLLAKDKYGNTVCYTAVSTGNLEMLEALRSWAKEAQLKPNELSELLLAKDKYGNTVCYTAVSTGNLEMLEALRSWAKEAQLKPNELSELLLDKTKYGKTVWHAAAVRGNFEVLEALWCWAKEAQLKPNELSELLLAKDEHGNTLCYTAVSTGNSEKLEALRSWAKEAQLKPNELSELLLAKDKYGNTVFYTAVSTRNLEMLEALRSWAEEAKLKPNELSELLLAKDEHGNTLCYTAVSTGNLEMLEALRSWAEDGKLKPNELSELLLAKDEHGNTLCYTAVSTGNLEMLEALRSWAEEGKLKPNELSELFLAKDQYGNTVWYGAVRTGNLEMLWALLSWAKEAQLKPNELSELLLAKDQYGHTMWHAAVETGDLQVIEALWSWAKEAQLTPNDLSELLLAKDKYGNIMCHAAVSTGNLKMLEALRSWAKEAKLKPNELCELLLAKDKHGKTVWPAAAETGNLEILEALWSWAKEAQLKPNELSEFVLAKDKYGNTMWHAGAEAGDIHVLNALFIWARIAKLQPNEVSDLLLAKDQYDNTVWPTAVSTGNLEMLESIRSWAEEAKLKPNDLCELLPAKDKYGNTMWHTAAETGNLEVLEALWSWAKKAQLKPNDLSELLLVKNKYGETMWHAAAETGNLEVLQALWRWAKDAQLKPNQLSKFLLAKDKYGYIEWNATVERGNLDKVEKFWISAKEGKLKPNELSKLLLGKEKYGNTAWSKCIWIRNLYMLETLWCLAKEAQLKSNELSELVLAKDEFGRTAWHIAAQEGNVKVLEAFWSWAKEAQLKQNQLSELLLVRDNYGTTLWHAAAAAEGNLKVLEALWSWAKEAQLKSNELSELVLAKDEHGRTAWHIAAQEGNLKVLEALWSWAKEAQLKPNEINELLLAESKYGNTMWHAAAGNLKVLEVLWSSCKEAQLNPNELHLFLLAKDKYGNTVWHAAAETGNLKVIEALWSWAKEAQLKPNQLSRLLLANDHYDNTVRPTTISTGKLEMLGSLLSWAKEAQLKPNDLIELLLAKDEDGDTVWNAAAERGNFKLLGLLWSWAKKAQLKPYDLIELLLAKDKDGDSVWNAAAKRCNLKVLGVLWSLAKEAQLKPNELSRLLLSKDRFGRMVWCSAALGGNVMVLKSLRCWAKEAQLKPNDLIELLLAKDNDGYSVWNAAAKGCNLKVLGVLWSLAKEAQPKPNELSRLLVSKDRFGGTVWRVAAVEGNVMVLKSLRCWAKEAQLKLSILIELLLAKDMDVNSAWHEAAVRGNLLLQELCCWCKEAQLKPNELSELLLAKDNHGRTLWHATARTGNLEMLEVLWSCVKEAKLKPNELSELLLAKGEYGFTAWHAAAVSGNLKALDSLWSWAKEAQRKPSGLNELLVAKDEYGNTVWLKEAEDDLDELDALQFGLRKHN